LDGLMDRRGRDISCFGCTLAVLGRVPAAFHYDSYVHIDAMRRERVKGIRIGTGSRFLLTRMSFSCLLFTTEGVFRVLRYSLGSLLLVDRQGTLFPT
jgi:hypothetical protein